MIRIIWHKKERLTKVKKVAAKVRVKIKKGKKKGKYKTVKKVRSVKVSAGSLQTATDISSFLEQASWSGADQEASRTVEMSLTHSPHDSNFKEPALALGDIIEMYEDKKRLFYGRVTGAEKQGEKGSVTYTCKDFMNNLLKSKISQKYKNKTAEYIAKAVCGKIGIKTGTLIRTGVKIAKHYGTENAAYNVIMNAYAKAAAKTGKKYMPRMNGAKFEVVEKGAVIGRGYNDLTGKYENTLILGNDLAITSSRITTNVDDMVNRVAMYNKHGKQIGFVKKSNWIAIHGVLQEAVTGKSKAVAKTKLQGASKSVELELLGDNRCIAGAGIYIKDPDSGIVGSFWIESDTHTYSSGKHTMSLTLRFSNVMEKPEMQYSAGTKKSSSTSSGGKILNGRKVRALYTAYYPANSQGGLKAANGETLKPGKKTCAAPKSIKFGTKIQIASVPGYGSVKNKVYRVNDRGGAITVKNGVYHFDLLFPNAKRAESFGRRTGTAIIGNGTGYHQRGASGESAKAEKLIRYAKKFVGKVRYVLGSASPQKGRCDCSGYVMYCYKHALGITLPHYSVSQAKKGRKISKISQMKAGDIVIMHTGWRHNARSIPDHVGIYAGNGYILQVGHAGCTYRKMSNFRSVFLYARRLI